MKKILMPLAIAAVFACNSTEKKDSVETAQEANEQKADSANSNTASANTATTPVDKDDQEFLVKAASGGLMEVQLGQMTAQKATNTAVKNFGQMMVSEHSKANDELKALAAQKNITIPTTPGEDEQKHINKLNDAKTGRDFDRDYMAMMVDDHKEDVRKFEKAANECKDPDIKAFAAKYLPALRAHLDSAQAIRDKIKKS